MARNLFEIMSIYIPFEVGHFGAYFKVFSKFLTWPYHFDLVLGLCFSGNSNCRRSDLFEEVGTDTITSAL